MKIDSPTFLTETTFISSSVVFSSGSQKIGNTDDDQHIVIGNFSGSAKSTGSFGAVTIGPVPDNDVDYPLEVEGDMRISGDIYGFSTSTRQYVRKRLSFGFGTDYFSGGVTHEYNHIFKDMNGNMLFHISGDGTKVSGSSVSTGSFGSVHTAGRVGVGTTAPNSSIHVNASDQYSLIRFTNSGASTGGQFGFTNDDAYVWNNEGSGKIILGTNSTARLTITHDAKVGINVGDPDASLEVSSLGTSKKIIWATDSSGNDLGGFYETSNNGVQLYGFDGSHNEAFIISGVGESHFSAGNVEFRAANAKISGSSTSTGSFGNIRVGDKTASENRFMSFAGDEGFKIGYAQSGFLAHDGQGSEGVDAEISMTGTGGSAPFNNHGSIVYKTRAVSILARSSHIFYTGRASAERLRIDHVGNVGIGEAAPSEKLSMGGNIFLTDGSPKIYFTDTGVGNSAEIKRESHTLKLTEYSSGVKSSEIHLQGRAAGDGASRGGILFRTATHQHTTNGPQDAVYINLSGSVELMRDGANLSGSSTSTGSFGHLNLAGASDATVTGHLVPSADGTFDLGTTNSQDWRKIYAREIDLANSQFIAEVGGSIVLLNDHAAIGNGFRFTHRNTKLFEVGDSNNRPVISGSSASTGSFGRIEIHGQSSGYLSTISVQDGVHNGILQLRGSTRVANPGSYIQLYGPNGSYGKAVFNYGYNQTHSELSFQVDGSERVRFGGLGEIEAKSLTATGNISGSISSTGSFGMITTPSDISGKPAARLHEFAFLRASDPGDNSTSGYNSKSGNTIFGYDAGSQIVQNNGAGHSNTYIGHFAGHGNASGDHNTFLGHVAGGVGGSGDDNVSIGSYSGYNLLAANRNILIGRSSGTNMRSGSNNVAIGRDVLYTSRGANNNVAIGDSAAYYATTGYLFTAVGSNAGQNATTGAGWVGIGYKAGYAQVDHGYWIAIGYEALGGTATTNQGNGIAIGMRAMFEVKDGSSGVAIGNSALTYLVGQYSTAVGDEAGRYATGSYNTFLGNSAGKGSTSAPYASGERNVAVGYSALGNFTTGYRNVAIGDRAAAGTTTGNSGVYIGYLAGYGGNQSGNVAIGPEALFTANGNSNVAVGYQAGRYTTSNDGVWIGANAGKDGAGGGQSSIVGHYAGQYIVGSEVTLIGQQAGRYASGSRNTFVGAQAGKGGTTSAPYSSGQYNVAMGYLALSGFTTGHSNVAIGYQAGQSISTAHENTIVGYQAGQNVTTADNNVIMGFQAGQSLTSARYNVLIGDGAGKNLTTQNGNNENVFIGNGAGEMADEDGDGVNQSATDNVYVGSGAGYYLDDGAFNVIIGKEAGKSASGTQRNAIRNVILGMEAAKDITTSDDNVIVGYQAGDSITTGPRNTLVGYQAGDAIGVGENNVMIGYGADANATATSNTIVIGTNVTPTSSGQTILGTATQTFTLIGGGKAICRVAPHNIAAGNSKTITVELAAHQGWISGVMHIVASDSGNNGGGVYQVSFSAFLDADATTTDITQTIIHSDRGPGSSNYIELNSPTAGTGKINWVLDNDHSGAFNSLTITVEAYMADNPARYLSLSTS